MAVSTIRLLAIVAAALPTIAFAAAPAATPASQSADDLLAAERWQEDRYGLSLRPPLDSTLQKDTSGQTLLRIAGPQKYSIEVYLREVKSDQEVGEFLQSNPNRPQAPPTRITYDNRVPIALDIESIVSLGLKQVEIAHPGVVLLDQQRLPLGPYPAAILFFTLPPAENNTQWVLGHAYMLINDHAFAMLRLLVAADQLPKVQPRFEAVVRSLQVQDPAERDRQRQQQVQAGEQWRGDLTLQQYQQSLVPEQWLRLLDGDRDIGYVHITQTSGQQLNEPGLLVRVQARVLQGPETLDSLSEFFLFDNRQREIWSTKVTRRLTTPAAPAAAGTAVPPEVTVAETGVRSGDQVEVTRQEAAAGKKYTWQTPPHGYLSQAEIYLLPQVLPRRQTPVMGFYAYYPNSGSIAYRTVQVQPGQDGAYRVIVQPAPNQPQEISLYDATGKLIERQLATGRRMIPTDPRKLPSIWKQEQH